jgi:hypothetical protein
MELGYFFDRINGVGSSCTIDVVIGCSDELNRWFGTNFVSTYYYLCIISIFMYFL